MSKPPPIAWAVWDTPDRVAAHPAIEDGLGQDEPRLVFITFANGALKVSATRRPRMHLTESARHAHAAHTWIDGALVSEPDRNLHKVAETLRKRLQLAGRRNLGNGLFEALPVETALAVLSGIRDIAEPPRPPVREPVIPAFLRKETPMHAEESAGAGLPSLVVANTAIRQDREGRYCLNDLHKAAGGEKKHQPSNWLRADQTKELIEELQVEMSVPQIRGTEENQPVMTYQGGNDIQGTYVCKELVYAYAMWISPRFHLTVIRAFDALVTGSRPEVGAMLPPEVEEACDARAWFLFNRLQESGKRLLGNTIREGDDERLMDSLFWIKSRIHDRLRAMAKRQLASRLDPQGVAAWILAWTPDRPALV